MADFIPQFEVEDRVGSLATVIGTVGTSTISVPTPTGYNIQEFIVINPDSNDYDRYIEVSLDGGTTFTGKIYPHGHYSQEIKGNQNSIHLKASHASTGFIVIFEKERANESI